MGKFPKFIAVVAASIFAVGFFSGAYKKFEGQPALDCSDASAETSIGQLRTCAEAGDPASQYLMFVHFEEKTTGYNITETNAVKWILKAGESGNIDAKLKLMRLYKGSFEKRRYVPKYKSLPLDEDKSKALARELALKGVAKAQYFHGVFGLSAYTQETYIRSYRWLIEAAKNGDELAISEVNFRRRRAGDELYLEAMALKDEEWRK